MALQQPLLRHSRTLQEETLASRLSLTAKRLLRRKPRYRQPGDSEGPTKQESLCWILMGASHEKIMLRLAQDPEWETLDLALGLCMHYSLFSATAEYAASFSNDDAVHLGFFTLLGSGIFLMSSQWTGDVLASGDDHRRAVYFRSLAFCYLVIVAINGRVYAALPYWRPLQRVQVLTSGGCAGLALLASRMELSSLGCKACCWSICLVAALRAKRSCRIHCELDSKSAKPARTRCHLKRIDSFLTTIVALLVKGTLKAVGRYELDTDGLIVLLVIFAQMFLVKLLMFDVDAVDPQLHAMHTSERGLKAVLWQAMVLLTVAGIVRQGAGSYLLLRSAFEHSPPEGLRVSGPYLLCSGFVEMVLAITVQRLMHAAAPETGQRPALRRALWLQIASQLAAAAVAAALALREPSGHTAFATCICLSSLLILVNYVDEVLEIQWAKVDLGLASGEDRAL